MATVLKIVKPALQHIVVQGSEAALEPAEYQDAIDALNNMMAAYESKNIDVGWTVVSDVSDTVTVDDGAIEGLAALLAVKLAPEFDATPSAELHAMAREGKNTLYILGQTITATEEPENLPIGSGNESYQSRRFYGPAS